MLIDSRIDTWLTAAPSLSGDARRDARRLASYAQTGEQYVRSLGPKPRRTRDERKIAAAIHARCRGLRRRFMAMHAEWLYALLTNDRTTRKTLNELAYGAADACPGLTPTAAQIAAERSLRQSDKEGHEIDQGILFHGFLRAPNAGAHIMDTVLQPTRRALQLMPSFRADQVLNLGTVTIERRDGAAYVTMNNCDCLNAEDDRFVEDLETAVDLALLDDDVRVGVLRGGVMTHPRYAGRRVFSAGINLKALHSGGISLIEFILRRELGYLNKIVRGVRRDADACGWGGEMGGDAVEKPWIGCLEGFAIGGGAQVLLVLDRVIAASDAYFSLPAAQEGIVPGFANFRLARFLGHRGARQVILGGRRISADESDARLIFDEVVAPSGIDAAIEAHVRQLGSPALSANRHMMNFADEPADAFLRYVAEFALVQSERLYSDDVLEKVFGNWGRT